jgi:hypothetical protein
MHYIKTNITCELARSTHVAVVIYVIKTLLCSVGENRNIFKMRCFRLLFRFLELLGSAFRSIEPYLEGHSDFSFIVVSNFLDCLFSCAVEVKVSRQ